MTFETVDTLSYCILAIVFTFMDKLSKSLFKLTNKEYYELLKNHNDINVYEISLSCLIKNKMDLKFYELYYSKINNIRNCYYRMQYIDNLMKDSIFYDNIDSFVWLSNKINTSSRSSPNSPFSVPSFRPCPISLYVRMLIYAIEKDKFLFIKYFLINRNKIQNQYMKYIDDDYYYRNNKYDKFDIINKDYIKDEILNACIMKENKTVIKLFNEYDCLYKYSFLIKMIKLNKLDLFKWFIIDICNNKFDGQEDFLSYSIYREAFFSFKHDFLRASKQLNLELSNEHIDDFKKYATLNRDYKLLDTLECIF